jgi:Flp pilus assembly protein TadD
MSLLLDALKKAAEQKAEKNRQEVPQAGSSDETVIDAAEDISALEGGVDGSLQKARRPSSDETEIDHSDFDTRLERAQVGRDDGTETLLEKPDPTVTESPSLSEQMQSGEDETIIFAEEDVAEFMGEPEFVSREPRANEDETDLSQLESRGDVTEISEPPPRDSADETDLSQLTLRGGATDINEPPPRDSVDETDLSQLLQREDETDISVPPQSVADLEHAAAQRAADATESDISQLTEPVEDITDSGDEDMSLLLVERDQTNLTTPTSATDPQMPQEQIQVLQDGGGDDGLALVDTTRHRMPDETVQSADDTRGSATATTGISPDTLTGATTRTEATSTRTYAPDNYDRTLMRLPSEDASKLFAGMKSDSDVVMTPEYAKKVFHSKSSAQRLQHYKFYGGIAIVIMLAIGIYGLFEYQNQSASIDASLRPLKRDPMPGIIRPEKEAKSNGLFSGAEVDERTITLIESADDEIVPDTGVIAEDSESEPEVVAADSTAPPEALAETGAAADTETVSQPEAVSEAPSQARQDTSTADVEEPAAAAEVASSAQPLAEDSEVGDSSASLKISSGERVEQKSIWLREAYAAYQAGNDELAMSLYNKVLELDPSNRNALLARAAIHVQNNNSQDAIRDYQALLLANPKDSLAMASLLAIANYSPQDSETQLKLMLRAEPDSPYLNFALANAYGAQNRWQEAQGYYFKALEKNPGDPNYAYNLAVSLEHIAQPRAAVSYYRRALDNFGNGLATFSREVVDQRLKMLGKL